MAEVTSNNLFFITITAVLSGLLFWAYPFLTLTVAILAVIVYTINQNKQVLHHFASFDVARIWTGANNVPGRSESNHFGNLNLPSPIPISNDSSVIRNRKISVENIHNSTPRPYAVSPESRLLSFGQISPRLIRYQNEERSKNMYFSSPHFKNLNRGEINPNSSLVTAFSVPNKFNPGGDAALFTNVKSPGFTGRIIKYATSEGEKPGASVTHQDKYSVVGLFPVVQLAAPSLPTLSPRNSQKVASNSVRIRVAPPVFNERQNCQVREPYRPDGIVKSVLESLQEASRKRIYSQCHEITEEDASKKRQRRNTIPNPDGNAYKYRHIRVPHLPISPGTVIQPDILQQNKRSCEESSSIEDLKKRRRKVGLTNNEISSSLSSSQKLLQQLTGNKRKADNDWSPLSTPIQEKQFRENSVISSPPQSGWIEPSTSSESKATARTHEVVRSLLKAGESKTSTRRQNVESSQSLKQNSSSSSTLVNPVKRSKTNKDVNPTKKVNRNANLFRKEVTAVVPASNEGGVPKKSSWMLHPPDADEICLLQEENAQLDRPERLQSLFARISGQDQAGREFQQRSNKKGVHDLRATSDFTKSGKDLTPSVPLQSTLGSKDETDSSKTSVIPTDAQTLSVDNVTPETSRNSTVDTRQPFTFSPPVPIGPTPKISFQIADPKPTGVSQSDIPKDIPSSSSTSFKSINPNFDLSKNSSCAIQKPNESPLTSKSPESIADVNSESKTTSFASSPSSGFIFNSTSFSVPYVTVTSSPISVPSTIQSTPSEAPVNKSASSASSAQNKPVVQFSFPSINTTTDKAETSPGQNVVLPFSLPTEKSTSSICVPSTTSSLFSVPTANTVPTFSFNSTENTPLVKTASFPPTATTSSFRIDSSFPHTSSVFSSPTFSSAFQLKLPATSKDTDPATTTASPPYSLDKPAEVSNAAFTSVAATSSASGLRFATSASSDCEPKASTTATLPTNTFFKKVEGASSNTLQDPSKNSFRFGAPSQSNIFGTSASNPPAFGSSNPLQTNEKTFGFGASTNNASAASALQGPSTFSFVVSTASSSSSSSVGLSSTPQQAPASASAPTFGVTTSSFGNFSATPSFGSTESTNVFGTPVSSSVPTFGASSGSAFGSPSTNVQGSAVFGAVSSAPPTTAFSAPSQPSIMFGSPPSTQIGWGSGNENSTNFHFGSPNPNNPLDGGSSTGQPPAPASAANFNFGSNAVAPQPQQPFQFGQNLNAAPPASTFQFGSQNSQVAGLSFGSPSTSFGTMTNPPTLGSFNIGSGAPIFNIGAGSTQSQRSRIIREAKRRGRP